MFTNLKKKLRRLLAMVISALLVINVVVPVEAKAQESPYDPITHLNDAYSYAYGGLLDLRLLNEWLTIGENGPALSAAELKGVEQLWETVLDNDENVEASSIDLEALELIYLNLGHISLPLLGEGGLLEFVLNDASVGVLREYAHAPSAAHAHGAAGVVSDSGGLELTQPGQGKSASVDILSLLNLQGSELITESVIKEAALELGAISAVAINPDDSEFVDYNVTCDTELTATNISTDPDKPETICHGYQIADAIVVLDAPIVETLMDTITDLLRGLDATLNTALGQSGLFDTLLDGIGDLISVVTLGTVNLDLSVTAQVPVPAILDGLLNEELSDESGLVKIDLQDGIIKVDLAQLHTGGLNGLPANTNLLTADNINAITASVLSLLTDDATENPNGLMARLESALIGDVDPITGKNLRTGGLYDTKLSILLESSGFLETLAGSLEISGTLGQMFSGGFNYSGTGLLGLTTILGSILNPLTQGVGLIVEELLFDGPTSIVSMLLSSARNAALTQLVGVLDPVLRQVLAPLANVIINRQTTQEVGHGTVFTVSAIEVNVLDVNSSGELIHLPLATASAMAQPPVTMDFDVAKVGDGRNLHTGGYTYDLVCTVGTGEDQREVVNKTNLLYAENNVGDGFFYTTDADNLSLTGADGGMETLRITPGAECTVTATTAALNETDAALRPTGADDGTRTPYTYFLDVDKTDGVRVSGGTTPEGLTEMTSIGAPEGQVDVDSSTVGDEWKNHTFKFVVPTEKSSHRVSIVHAYDLDRRDIEITKAVAGASVEDKFAFQYSLDDGDTWVDADTTIGHGETLTIKDVPVLNDSLEDTTVMIREDLGTNPAGPLVSWKLNNADLTNTYGDGYATTASFVSGPVATVPTPKQQIDITNSYAAINVDKHIDGLLDGIGSTTLVPAGNTEMTIRYTVENTGPVDLDTITIYDLSLINDQFTLPTGITVDSTTGEVNGCILTFVEGVATCEFTVPPTENFSHYEADEAEATIVATTTIDGRTVTAAGEDTHGAMRLPDLAAMLPNTGATTLVWVLGLGVLIALAALVNYIRSRRN